MAKDPLNDLSMKPSRDDLALRQTQGGRKRSHSVDVKGKQQPPGSRNGPLLIVLLLIVAGAGAGGWLMWQEVEKLSAELAQSKEMLSESRTNLGDLQQNIASQSSTLDQTGSKIREELDFHMSEIRKLWDLSNKTNKPDIQANEKAIAGAKSTLASQKKQLTVVQSDLKAAQKAAQTAQAQAKQAQLQSSAINSQVSELETQLSELTAQNKALKNMINSQEAVIKELQSTAGKALNNQLTDIVQRLDSIDAHRRQVNARLDQHDRNITELYQKP